MSIYIQFRRSGTRFSCGKVGLWRSECPLLAVAHTPEGKKLSDFSMNVTSTQFILQDDVVSNVDVWQEGGCKVQSRDRF